jgi:hypothetical protein
MSLFCDIFSWQQKQAFSKLFQVIAVIICNSKRWEQLKILEISEFFGTKFDKRINE